VREVGATVDAPGDKRWVSVGALAVLAAAAATSIVLAGTDVSIVAALRETGDTAAIGWVLSVWGAGSLVGGLVYGAWHRSISVFWLLAGLAASTVPVALAGSLPWLVVLLFLCGVLCAPTITATLDHLARLVPEGSRGEAMGWHGSAMTAGQAIGAPLAGFAIDHAGWGWGFVSVSLVALAIAVVGGVAERIRRATRLRPA
jgi:MFS family permease